MEANESLVTSPFAIPPEEAEALCAEEGFRVLRKYLEKETGFCDFHATKCDKEAQETWLLHRDLLHALVMPIVELHKRASVLAGAALCTPKGVDLELAFAGEARSAFLWLQCFVGEEEEWCRTSGCPACVTTATLSTESHIRLTIAASLLSTASVSSPTASPTASETSSPAMSPIAEEPLQSPSTDSTLSLPPLPHILPALRTALDTDPFWGPDYFAYLFSRASQLSAGIQALIGECVDLESLVSSPTTQKPVAKRSTTTPAFLASAKTAEGKGAKLRKSRLAKRQQRMEKEEVELMRRCALQCWARVAVPSRVRGELLGRSEKHVRSLTCP